MKVNKKHRARKIEPPSNLPIYSADADIWEDGTPEEIVCQVAFQRKLQFAAAFASVAVLMSAGIFQGHQQVLRVAEHVSPVVLSSAVALQQEVWEKGFTAGNQGAGIDEIMQEYFGWLGDQIRDIK